MTRIRKTADGIAFRCPGCGDTHAIPTTGPAAWNWNGDLDLPTITPSIAIRSGHYASHWKPGDECWCGKDYEYKCGICHSGIAAGRITFGTDSTHALAGQTVDLPELDL